VQIKKASALVASQILPFSELSSEFADGRAIIFFRLRGLLNR